MHSVPNLPFSALSHRLSANHEERITHNESRMTSQAVCTRARQGSGSSWLGPKTLGVARPCMPEATKARRRRGRLRPTAGLAHPQRQSAQIGEISGKKVFCSKSASSAACSCGFVGLVAEKQSVCTYFNVILGTSRVGPESSRQNGRYNTVVFPRRSRVSQKRNESDLDPSKPGPLNASVHATDRDGVHLGGEAGRSAVGL